MVDIGMGLALQRCRHSVPLRPQDRYDEAVALLRTVHSGFETTVIEIFWRISTKIRKGSSFCECSILLGFYYVKKTKRFVILSSDKSSERNLSCFFDMIKPRRGEHL